MTMMQLLVVRITTLLLLLACFFPSTQSSMDEVVRQTNDSQDQTPPTRVRLLPFGIELDPASFDMEVERQLRTVVEEAISVQLSTEFQYFDYVFLDYLELQSDHHDSNERNHNNNRFLVVQTTVFECSGGVVSFDTPLEETTPSQTIVMEWIEEAINHDVLPRLLNTTSTVMQNVKTVRFVSLAAPLGAEATPSSSSSSTMPWVLIGSTVAGALAVIAVILGVWRIAYLRYKKRNNREEQTSKRQESCATLHDDANDSSNDGNDGCSTEGGSIASQQQQQQHAEDLETAVTDHCAAHPQDDDDEATTSTNVEEELDDTIKSSFGCEESTTARSSIMFPTIMETESFQIRFQPVIRKDMLHTTTTEAFESGNRDIVMKATSTTTKKKWISNLSEKDNDEGSVRSSSSKFVFESEGGEKVHLKTSKQATP